MHNLIYYKFKIETRDEEGYLKNTTVRIYASTLSSSVEHLQKLIKIAMEDFPSLSDYEIKIVAIPNETMRIEFEPPGWDKIPTDYVLYQM
jgi:hypothetical protein